MNILVVTDKLFPDETGGSCTYAYETAVNLKKLNNNVDIFTSYPNKAYNDNLFSGINLYRYLNKKRLYKSSLKLANVINNRKYEYIIFHSAISWFIYYLAKRKIQYKIKKIGIFHGPWYKEAKLKYKSKKQYYKLAIVPIMKFIEYMYASDVKRFLFLSNYMRNELIEICDKAEKSIYTIIPGGVNIDKHKRLFSKLEARKILNLSSNDFIIFSLRRLEYRMGLHNAIDSLDDINIENKNVTYIIGGKGPFEYELKKRAQNLKKSKCMFEGFIPEDKLNLFFCAADLFLVPSIDLEGFGLVILESLAMELPVLATPQGGMKEYGNEIKGLFLTKGFLSKDISEGINKVYQEISKTDFSCLEISSYDWSNITYQINRFLVDSGEIE